LARERRTLEERFADFVKAGMKIKKSPWEDLKGQIYLGDESFVKTVLGYVSEDRDVAAGDSQGAEVCKQTGVEPSIFRRN